ncbi:unnamed protein product, partial [Mesorhabditis belari]|uniref:C2H2-type domain-containing protein n=1 Tax=Mesorhabditis belari TaxID=2138241 RepID=A0AAF3J8A0_9BILA
MRPHARLFQEGKHPRWSKDQYRAENQHITICGESITMSTVMQHVEKHVRVLSRACSACEFYASREQLVQQHIREVHPRTEQCIPIRCVDEVKTREQTRQIVEEMFPELIAKRNLIGMVCGQKRKSLDETSERQAKAQRVEGGAQHFQPLNAPRHKSIRPVVDRRRIF